MGRELAVGFVVNDRPLPPHHRDGTGKDPVRDAGLQQSKQSAPRIRDFGHRNEACLADGPATSRPQTAAHGTFVA